MTQTDTGEEVVITQILEPGIAVIRMNRPHRLNAMSMELVEALHRAVEFVDSDQSVRVAILTGAGRAFCAGVDIKGGPDPGDPGTPIDSGIIPQSLQVQEFIASLHERIHRSKKPFIAAVNGVAGGGGFSLTLACDIRMAAEQAQFGAIFIKLGISACDMGTSYFLPRLVGASRSAELLLTGRTFDAHEAHQMGLVSDLVPAENLMEVAVAKAREIAANAPLAVWMTKETMWQTIDSPSLRSALDMENRTQILCTATGAFGEKSKRFKSSAGRPQDSNNSKDYQDSQNPQEAK